jgi:hypothetical protein
VDYRLGTVKLGRFLEYFVLTIEGANYQAYSYSYDENVIAVNRWRSGLVKDELTNQITIETWEGMGSTEKFKDHELLINWYNSLEEFDGIVHFPPDEEGY